LSKKLGVADCLARRWAPSFHQMPLLIISFSKLPSSFKPQTSNSFPTTARTSGFRTNRENNRLMFRIIDNKLEISKKIMTTMKICFYYTIDYKKL
jgi:hypothetical protein